MSLDLISTVLAHPATIVTVYPTLLITAIANGMEWHRLGQDDDAFTIDDYHPAPATGRAPVRRLRPIDAPTATIPAARPDALPAAPAGTDAGSPLYYELRARQILADLGQSARVNTVNTGGAL